jgi:hypothetical protein
MIRPFGHTVSPGFQTLRFERLVIDVEATKGKGSQAGALWRCYNLGNAQGEIRIPSSRLSLQPSDHRPGK